MKTINIFAGFALAASVALMSCSDDFLDVTPPTQTPIEEYFTTEEHVYEALIAAYDPLHWPDWDGAQYNSINLMSDIMADDIWPGGASRNDNQYMHLMMNFEANPENCMTGLWSDEYSGVKRCNDVLTYLGWAADNISQEKRESWEAQARVLRAYYYCNLWKFWGNIPFYMENLGMPYLAEQKKADDVYEAVITDLEAVIGTGVLPMRWEDTASEYNVGKVSQAMAYMLYTEMVMYQNDESRYSKALGYMREIINDPDYDLLDSYAEIFEESGEWGKESIFEVNYKDDNAMRSWDTPLVAGGTVLPRLISPSAWAPNPGDDCGVVNGWGFGPVRTEAYKMYAKGDTRRDVTCFDANAHGTYEHRYQDTGYFLGKYIGKSENNKDQSADVDLNFNNNLRVYRYAETLLNAAELIVRTGGDTGEASRYLNKVHHRAGLTDDVAPTIDNIVQERRLEFVGEGKRYWDLVRTGKAAATLVPDQYNYRTNAWSESKKYLPIPQSEMDAAQGTLTQNDY